MSIILWIITLTALFSEIYVLIRKRGIRYYDAIPLSLSGLILSIFTLAFFKAMEFIFIPAIGLLIFNIIRLIREKDTATDDIKARRYEDLIMTGAFIILCVIISLLTADHVVKWWDDLNFWATDTKGLYYLNGYTGKYGNVAPEFGDYPPAIQIVKWCLLKLSRNEYREGLAFCGYYIMNAAFLLPLMRFIDIPSFNKSRSEGHISIPAILSQIIWMPVIMLIPGIVNDVWSFGSCSDVTMGIVYGAMLLAIYDLLDPFDLSGRGRSATVNNRIYVSIALYGAVTALCKNTGFMWTGFATILLIISVINLNKRHKDGTNTISISLPKAIGAAAFVWIIQVSWWTFCISHRRIAKLTGALAKTATKKGFSLPGDAAEKLHAYIGGFVSQPMHISNTPMLDFSAMWMFVLLFTIMFWVVLTCAVKRTTSADKQSIEAISVSPSVILGVYVILTGIFIYITVLMSHMSIFATETQYGTAEVMAISISRYGAPFTIGSFMLAISVLRDLMVRFDITLKGKSGVVTCVIATGLFIVLSTDYPAYGYMLHGYREEIEADIQARNEMIDPEGQRFIDYIENIKETALYGEVIDHRVLFFRDDSNIHWVKDTYINYEVSPIAVVYTDYNADMTEEKMREAIDTIHADYIYRDGIGIERADSFTAP